MTLYFIPGLGFDRRIFQNLNLRGLERRYLDWIEPEKSESIKNYATRLAAPIEPTSKDVVIIGHSLGGILSQEIAKLKKVKLIILLSSVRSRKEIPLFFRMIEPTGLYHLFTKKITLSTFSLWGKNHDYVTQEEQALFKAMLSKQSNIYLQWALRTLSVWGKEVQEDVSSVKVIQIHGRLDKTFPVHLLDQVDEVVNEAGHFMVFKKPEEVSKLILKHL